MTTDRREALEVDWPCDPPTTHRFRRVGKSNILCCKRCGQGKVDIVGFALAADPPALDAARGRWAFLDTETGDWIEVKPGVVHIARLAREEMG